MTVDYREFLAAEILSDQHAVNYRSVSRAMKVPVDQAKQMLSEFHQQENKRKPGSIHATYLITGIRKEHFSPDMDVGALPMNSSPPRNTTDPSKQDMMRFTTITLVKEEQLEEVKKLYRLILSIHIWSLEPGSLKDLEILSTITENMRLKYDNEDQLEFWKQYGIIQNPNAKKSKRRLIKVQEKKPMGSGPRLKQPSNSIKEAAPDAPESTEKQTTLKSMFEGAMTNKSFKKSADKPQPRRDVSDILKAFGKAKLTVKKEDSESDSDKTGLGEDVPMNDLSDSDDEVKEEEDEDAMYLDKAPESSEPARNPRREREEKLRKMMEDDVVMDEAKSDSDEASTHSASTGPPEKPEPVKQQEQEPEQEPEQEHEQKQEQEQEQEPATLKYGVNNHRRGRRRVTKKVTTKDEEGYLVTKEETTWESFSEEEAPSPPRKKTHLALMKKGKSKGSAAQGDIMSFFKKK